uniref:Rhodanese domain-containing protein n=1 Tax=Acrobeloides nanus TaxID=290746 RepID=A0A914C3V5_9BILA
MQLSKLIDAHNLNSLIRKATSGFRILDCTYNRVVPPEMQNPKEFKEKHYGKIEELLKLPSPHRDIYLQSHIPTAVHIDLNIAMYPGRYQKFSLYEPEIFEKYIQLLGVNAGDHLILYGRGPFGGMLWPAKFYWLFKSYGHHKVSLVNGGFADWIRNGFGIESFKETPKIKSGNWEAKDRLDLNITYEELVKNEPENSTDLNELAKKANILDSRIRGQYEGTEETGLDPYNVEGCYIPGTKNVPVVELVDENGHLKDKEEIDKYLKKANFEPNKPAITMCNLGIQASLLSFILEEIHPKIPTRLYNGSMKEMEVRDPRRISGTPKRA